MTIPTINQPPDDVKRQYASPTRDAQGAATRARIRQAAERLFLANGFVGT